MSKVRTHMMMSLDGYAAGPNQTLEKPFGDAAEHLSDWVVHTRFFHEMTGQEGGDTGPNEQVMRESMHNIGANIMGRNMFGGGHGDWGDRSWRGWWGENPPYHTPVFVLTHHPREPLHMEGGNTFYFVTSGIEAALQQAQEAAGDLDIRINGGAQTVNEYLAAGHIDEIELHLVPLILGDGARLFENMPNLGTNLELIRTVVAPNVTHLKYHIAK